MYLYLINILNSFRIFINLKTYLKKKKREKYIHFKQLIYNTLINLFILY